MDLHSFLFLFFFLLVENVSLGQSRSNEALPTNQAVGIKNTLLATIEESINEKKEESHVCKFNENILGGSCNITLLFDEDGGTLASIECSNSKQSTITVKDHSALPLNQECSGLEFLMDMEVVGSKAKLTALSWKPLKCHFEADLLEVIVEKRTMVQFG